MIDEKEDCEDELQMAHINFDAKSIEEVRAAINPIVVAIHDLISVMPSNRAVIILMMRTIGYSFYNDLVDYIIDKQLSEIAVRNNEGIYSAAKLDYCSIN